MTERSLAEVESALARRWPESRLDPTLERVRDLLDVLGSPQTAYPVLLVAGTNGKTSTARMVDALLRELGLRVGRYTSPHLERVTERISLDGEPLADDRFVQAFTEIEPYLDLVDARHEHPLSYFETLTALAYAVFADAPVDVAVVEVGMGGTWDATNVVDATVAVVTPVGLDHQAYLGDTIELIAGEKAGIVKAGGFAVLARQEVAAAEVLLRRVAEVGATVAREGLEFGVLTRSLAVGGQLLELRGLAGTYPDVLRAAAAERTRRTTPRSPSPPSRRCSATVGTSWTSTRCGPGSPPRGRRAASRSSAAGRPCCSMLRTTRPGPGCSHRRSSPTSPSRGWSPSSGCWTTRTRTVCWKRWSRRSTRWS